jgi:predicted ATP-grasp superfamily ATP-dependent carboligase
MRGSELSASARAAVDLNRLAPASVSALQGRPANRHGKLLIVATTFGLPYKVLRCARMCSAEVYVFGDLGAQALRLSRYCHRFIRSHRIINGGFDAALALEINHLVRELGITMIMPGDAPSTRALIACRDLLAVPCFPMPSLAQFDRLNDKYLFAALCNELGLRHPKSEYFETIEDLRADVAVNGVPAPVVLKPLSLSGNQGVMIMDSTNAARQLARLNYEPIIRQDFIRGHDISASMFCRNGEVRAFITNVSRRRVFSTLTIDGVFEDLQRVAAHTSITGVFNFDIRVADAGGHYYLECNPRFYFKMALAMLAGLNFVEHGLSDNPELACQRLADGTKVRAPEAVLATPSCWLQLSRRDVQAALLAVTDPVPYLFEQIVWPI